MRIRKQGPYDAAMNEEEILAAAKISDALAHPAPIRMLRFILSENIARRTVTNKDLVAVFDYAQATISQHLQKLTMGGLLDVQKKGTSSCYFARIGRLSVFTDLLKKIDTREEEVDIGEMPDFLKTELFQSDGVAVDLNDDLQLKYFSDSIDNGFDEVPLDL